VKLDFFASPAAVVNRWASWNGNWLFTLLMVTPFWFLFEFSGRLGCGVTSSQRP